MSTSHDRAHMTILCGIHARDEITETRNSGSGSSIVINGSPSIRASKW